MGLFAMGQAVRREEDPRLLRGEGEFIADLVLPRQAYGYVLRSPHGHARILSLDAAAARVDAGACSAFSRQDDLQADGIGTTRCRMPRKRPDGAPMVQTPHPGLARGQTHYVGDPVAAHVVSGDAG